MTKRFLLILLSLLFCVPTASADTGWKITDFKSAVTIQDDGYVRVQETIRVDFGALERHGIFRDPLDISLRTGKVLPLNQK